MKAYLIILFINFSFCFPLMAKTLFLGDSLTAVYEKSAKYILDEKIKTEYVSGSGLINKNKKDWIAFVNNFDLREFDNVIISLGTNDFVQYDPEEWRKYYSLVFQLIAKIQNKNPLATIIWISPPHIKNPLHECYLMHTRHIIKHSAILLNIHYLDINQPHILGTQWQSVIHNETVRTDDGIHITRKGGSTGDQRSGKNPEWAGLTKIKKRLKMNLLISLRNATCQCFGCLREAPTGGNDANVSAI